MIRTLWRSPQCLAVFKPAGLATQAPAPHDSLESRLRIELDQQNAAASYIALPHRLDRAVSGVVLVARSKRAAGLLGQQFQTRKVSKIYLAWVQGQPSDDHERWIDRLCKVPGQPRTEVVPAPGDQPADQDDPPAGQEAITEMRVVSRQPGGALLELQPLTGRMHQLRIQCAHRGYPILGDRLYGSTEPWPVDPGSGDPEVVGAETIALHAWKIRFHDPRNGQAVSVEAPPCWPLERLPAPRADG